MRNRSFVFICDFCLCLLPKQRLSNIVLWINRFKGVKIGANAVIFSTVQIYGNIEVVIGRDTFIGHESIITGGSASIVIGENCDISDRVSIFCGTHEIGNYKRAAGRGIGKNIIIGNGVWVGYGALILPGVSIGDGAIIAAGAVVVKNVQANTLVGGNPAKLIRHLYV